MASFDLSLNLPIIIIILFVAVIAYFLGRILRDLYWKEQIEEIRKDAIKRSRAVLSGQFSEQLAPYLPDFPFSPTECRFIGKPVDFIVFKGLDEKKVDEVVFVEVKSGKSSLSASEKILKDVIKEKKVSWVDYKVPEGLTTQ